MRRLYIFIASIALVSLSACSNEDSEPNVQKLDTALSVLQASEEWIKNHYLEGRNYMPGIRSRGGKTVVFSKGIGNSIEMAFCEAMANAAGSFGNKQTIITGTTISPEVAQLKMSPNLTVSTQITASEALIYSSDGKAYSTAEVAGQIDVNLFDYKLSCGFSDNSEKVVSSLAYSRTPGCESNEQMREFLDNEMKKEGHRIVKSFWAANCKGKVIEEEHYALILVVRPN